MDITKKLNELNLQFQGRDKEPAEMISDIKPFIKKLDFWVQNLNPPRYQAFSYSFRKDISKSIGTL